MVSRRSVACVGIVVLCLAPVVFAPSARAQEPALVARDAWVRQPLPSKDETALYLVIENHSPQHRYLVAVSAEGVDKAELHEMKMQGMMMRMNLIPQILVPAKNKATLSPNGLHVMLFGLKARPAVGDSLNVTLKFDDGTTVPVVATVKK